MKEFEINNLIEYHSFLFFFGGSLIFFSGIFFSDWSSGCGFLSCNGNWSVKSLFAMRFYGFDGSTI
jgi:hypothetical protein